jgi:hypothetical protein
VSVRIVSKVAAVRLADSSTKGVPGLYQAN